MRFRDYINAVRRRWKFAAVVVLVSLGVAAFVTFTATKTYVASTQIFVSTSADADNLAVIAQGNTFTQSRVQTYTAVATSPKVTQPVVDSLRLSITAAQLKAKITATAPAGKTLVNIAVVDRSGSEAAKLANAVADQFVTTITKLEATGGGTTASPVNLTVIEPAVAPTSPSSPKPFLNFGLALLVGLVLGAVAAVLRQFTDNTVKSAAEVTELSDLAVLGAVPMDKTAPDNVLALRSDPHGRRAEAFRQLKTNLQFIDVDHPPKVVSVHSALPGEGKTHIALNLAAALAESDLRVCVIEFDLRKPTIAERLGLVGNVGLTNVFTGQSEIEDVIQNAGRNLAVLTCGAVPPNPTELLSSEKCKQIIDEVASAVDFVILDTAPLLPVADGAQIAALADAALLTVHTGRTTRDQLARALGNLTNVGVVPVGAVMSMVRGSSLGSSEYYYERYYAPQPTTSTS
ncbi:polysaccharide biosynthesis tyrosine autokinase [Jatrophihabitans sp. YIM 134969]